MTSYEATWLNYISFSTCHGESNIAFTVRCSVMQTCWHLRSKFPLRWTVKITEFHPVEFGDKSTFPAVKLASELNKLWGCVTLNSMGTIPQAEWWIENSGSNKHKTICKTKLNGGRLCVKIATSKPMTGNLRRASWRFGMALMSVLKISVTTEELRNLPELEDFSQHRLKESLGRLHKALPSCGTGQTGCDLILTFAPFPLLLFKKCKYSKGFCWVYEGNMFYF